MYDYSQAVQGNGIQALDIMVCGETGAVTLQNSGLKSGKQQQQQQQQQHTQQLCLTSVLRSHQIDPGEVPLGPYIFESRKGWC